MERLPDQLDSEARVRHRVDSGSVVGARRGINWPSGTTIVDDSINEEVVVTIPPTISAAPSGSAGGALDGSYPNPGIASSVAGSGLSESSDVLAVNVDGTTIEINSDTLRVKASGIGANELASTAVAASSYGDATNVASFTVDVDGRLTAAANVPISVSDSSDPWTVVTQASDNSITSNSTTGVATDLQFATVSGGVYEFEITLAYGIGASGTNPNLNFAVGEDGTGTRGQSHYVGINAAGNPVDNARDSGNTTFTVLGTGFATPDVVQIKGHHVSAGTATWQLLFKQNTSSTRALVVKAGSVLRYRRII